MFVMYQERKLCILGLEAFVILYARHENDGCNTHCLPTVCRLHETFTLVYRYLDETKHSCLLTVFDFLLRFMYYDSLIRDMNLLYRICPCFVFVQPLVQIKLLFASLSSLLPPYMYRDSA